MEPNDQQGTEGAPVPSKVVINGVEYDAQEAADLIGLGNKTRELEKQWNTPVDKVWPEYGKTTQTLKQTQSELEKARQQLASFETKRETGDVNAGDVQKAKEAARKLGLILDEDLTQKGYVRKEELDTYLDEREKLKNATNEVLSTADRLEKEIDGKDGRPRFNKRVVLAYANQYGFTDLNEAYEDMHKDQLDLWKQSQINANKPRNLSTLKGNAAVKEPKPVKIDDTNFNAALKESLWGTKE